ncbi:hypothetical protein HHUSO_G5624 [Huso huso]|uniref:Retropepsins domain-containing protein n=1 Tax=Huso huso TaxID=61971 RepID=A0ABR1A1F5_HUSHU
MDCHVVTTVNNLFSCSSPKTEYVVAVKIGDKSTVALLDSGCGQSLISSDLVGEHFSTDQAEVRIMCIHGDIKTYPATTVNLKIGSQEVKLKVGVLPRLPYPVIVGCDCTEFARLVQLREVFVATKEAGPSSGQDQELSELFPFDEEVLAEPGKTRKTRSQKYRTQAKPQRLPGGKYTSKSADPQKRVGQPNRESESLGSLEENLPEMWEELAVSPLDFKREQIEDKNLQYAFNQAVVPDEPRVRVKPFRIPESKQGDLAKEIKTMLELQVIEESNSDWCSPVLMVPKPDGTIRFCMDFERKKSERNIKV